MVDADILVQDHRTATATAAKRFFKHWLAGLTDKPQRLITNALRRYGAAAHEVMSEIQHRTSQYRTQS